jgi:NCAIR mutase (PurE)-related protein
LKFFFFKQTKQKKNANKAKKNVLHNEFSMEQLVYQVKSHRGLALRHLEMIFGPTKTKQDLQKELRKAVRSGRLRFSRKDGLYRYCG